MGYALHNGHLDHLPRISSIGLFRHFSAPKTIAVIAALVILLASAGAALAIRNKSLHKNALPGSSNGSAAAATSSKASNEPALSTQSSNTQANIQTNAATNSSSSTQLTVNGQSVPVPQNGSVQKSIKDSNGQTDVNVSVNNGSSGSASSYSSTNIQINSSSSSTTSSGDRLSDHR